MLNTCQPPCSWFSCKPHLCWCAPQAQSSSRQQAQQLVPRVRPETSLGSPMALTHSRKQSLDPHGGSIPCTSETSLWTKLLRENASCTFGTSWWDWGFAHRLPKGLCHHMMWLWQGQHTAQLQKRWDQLDLLQDSAGTTENPSSWWGWWRASHLENSFVKMIWESWWTPCWTCIWNMPLWQRTVMVFGQSVTSSWRRPSFCTQHWWDNSRLVSPVMTFPGQKTQGHAGVSSEKCHKDG